MRKAIIKQIKKGLRIDSFVNLKFDLNADGNGKIVVNLEHRPDIKLTEGEMNELRSHLGYFVQLVGEIEQTFISLKVIDKNNHEQQIRF